MLNQIYRDELKAKERQLLKQSMTASVHERNKIPAPSDALRRMHPVPFRPSSSNLTISPIDKYRTNHKLQELTRAFTAQHTEKHTEDKMEVRDAETGELTVLTSASWNGKEGRLPLDRSTILSMGTGRLDMKNPIANTTSSFLDDMDNYIGGNGGNNSANNDNTQYNYNDPTNLHHENVHCHPLVAQFLRDGPLVLQNHRHWSSKTGNIETPQHLTKAASSSSGNRSANMYWNATGGSDIQQTNDTKERSEGTDRLGALSGLHRVPSPSSPTLQSSAVIMMAKKYNRPDRTEDDQELFRILFRNTHSAQDTDVSNISRNVLEYSDYSDTRMNGGTDARNTGMNRSADSRMNGNTSARINRSADTGIIGSGDTRMTGGIDTRTNQRTGTRMYGRMNGTIEGEMGEEEEELESWDELEDKYYHQLMNLAKEQEELRRRRHRFGPQCDLSASSSSFFMKTTRETVPLPLDLGTDRSDRTDRSVRIERIEGPQGSPPSPSQSNRPPLSSLGNRPLLSSQSNRSQSRRKSSHFLHASIHEKGQILPRRKRETVYLPSVAVVPFRRLETTYRELARQKTKGLKELAQAVKDELDREVKAKSVAKLSRFPPKAGSKQMGDVIKKESEIAKKKRVYIESLQYDNEVLLMYKMREAGMLW